MKTVDFTPYAEERDKEVRVPMVSFLSYMIEELYPQEKCLTYLCLPNTTWRDYKILNETCSPKIFGIGVERDRKVAAASLRNKPFGCALVQSELSNFMDIEPKYIDCGWLDFMSNVDTTTYCLEKMYKVLNPKRDCIPFSFTWHRGRDALCQIGRMEAQLGRQWPKNAWKNTDFRIDYAVALLNSNPGWSFEKVDVSHMKGALSPMLGLKGCFFNEL